MTLGIDIGSVSVKVVLTVNRRVIKTTYERFRGGVFETLHEVLATQFSDLEGQTLRLGLTGIGGRTAQSVLGGQFFGEIASLSAGNFIFAPEIVTVIEMGGEDSKLLILDGAKCLISDFAMNAQCAAGTGSFLDQQASRMKLSIEEFGQLSLKSTNPPRIAGRCSVFAKSDMIHLQQIATPDYDIVAGLCFAVARNFRSSIARGKEFTRPIAFEGGVASNPGVVRAFAEILKLQPDELIIPEHYNVMAALGASHLAQEAADADVVLKPEKIPTYLKSRESHSGSRQALSFDHPDSKFYFITEAASPSDIDGREVYLGIDVGSLSTNLVLIDDDLNVIARRYLMTEGRPLEAVKRGLKEIGEEVGDRVTVKAVGSTGSGRYLIGDFVGADIVRNEITAQATAAVSIDSEVDTVFEIGGQDSKYISLDKRAVVDFEMNKACAAGTGSFLQEQAEKLEINIDEEFGRRALKAKCPVGCGERCTVFMESDLVAHQRNGTDCDDLLAGLAYSIATNYLTRVVGDRKIGQNIFFQGGVAWNKAVVAAFEKLTGRKVTVPPHHDVTGAIGAAILAREQCDTTSEQHDAAGFATSFRGFDLYKRRYSVDTFTCQDCDNQCEIRRVTVQDERPLCYGARCEKHDAEGSEKATLPPDYATIRRKLLFGRYVNFKKPDQPRGRIGIPLVLHFYDYYPFWRAFFESLGYQVVNSSISNQAIVEQSLQLFIAETCFPIKMVFGHVADLLNKNVDTIFLPSIIRVADHQDESKGGSYVCPYIQNIASSVDARFDFEKSGVRLMKSTLSLSPDGADLRTRLKHLAADLKLSDRMLRRASEAGLKAFRQYRHQLQMEGRKALDEMAKDEKALVIVSRPYNGYDRRLSGDIPAKIRKLGYRAIPMDFLPIGDVGKDHPFMYWRYGKQILTVADYIRAHPNLFAVYMTSFACGPDSFITHFFRKRMAGKPYLQLELDEHSADAGLITRCEAFVDSLRFHKHTPPVSSFRITSDEFKPFDKTIYIPNMCDHAYGLRAAMERCGLTAEVLDEPDELTLEYGREFTSGKECFPCVVTTGDMIKKIRSDGFESSRAVFFMPGADGPCRFGLYSQFHRMVLEDIGHGDIPVLSPDSAIGYQEFGLDGAGFRKMAWQGLVFVDCLIKLLHEVRPFEVNRGETEKLYYHYLGRMNESILNDEPLHELGATAAADFSQILRSNETRPVVGVVGEIYLRNNRFSNNHLIEKLESLGLRVRMATFSEWPTYTSTTYRKDSWARKDIKGVIRSSLQLLVQNRHEHRIFNGFKSGFEMSEEEPVSTSLKLASNYLSLDCKGEALLSVGKAIEMCREGAAGVVNAMPFNCMPGTIVSSLSKKISDDLGGVPWLNISYEGLKDSGEETRLEAFAEQVRVFHYSDERKQVALARR